MRKDPNTSGSRADGVPSSSYLHRSYTSKASISLYHTRRSFAHTDRVPRYVYLFILKEVGNLHPPMKEYQREALIEKAEREGAALGADIPEVISLDGEEFELNEYVFEARAGEVDTGDIQEKKKLLRRKRSGLIDRLKDEEMTYEEGERVVERVTGLERALDVLEGIRRDTSVEAEARAKEKADEKRWLDFLKKVTGSSGDEKRR